MRQKKDDQIPKEYQAGFVEFAGCKIDLSRRPLIPRPETEFWARAAIIDLTKAKNKNCRVLDIFSGSGCVGAAAAKNLPDISVDFADIDKNAVEQIKINLKINQIADERTRVFESDIFKSIPSQTCYAAILANPPYVDPARIGQVQSSVLKHEPAGALFGGKAGLEIIEKFLAQAADFLAPAGFIYLEFDPLQKENIGVIIRKEGYSKFEFFKDQFCRWRFVKIIK